MFLFVHFQSYGDLEIKKEDVTSVDLTEGVLYVCLFASLGKLVASFMAVSRVFHVLVERFKISAAAQYTVCTRTIMTNV